MVNPAKLKSLVDQHAAGPSAAQLGMPASPTAEPPMDDEEDEDGSAPQDPAARGAELIDSWGEFGAALKDAAGEIHDQAHDVGADLMLKEVPPDVVKAVGKSVDRMPDDISMGLAKYVSKLPPEDITALSTALCAEVGEDKADANLMTAYLTQAAKYAGEEIDVDEDFNESEEEEEPEEEATEEEADPTEPAA